MEGDSGGCHAKWTKPGTKDIDLVTQLTSDPEKTVLSYGDTDPWWPELGIRLTQMRHHGALGGGRFHI